MENGLNSHEMNKSFIAYVKWLPTYKSIHDFGWLTNNPLRLSRQKEHVTFGITQRHTIITKMGSHQ